MDKPMFERDDYRAPSTEESAEVEERVTEEEATPISVVKRKSTRKKKAKATKRAQSRAIRSMYPGVLIVSNCPSGAKYTWSRPGAEVSVAGADVGFVMGKNSSKARECCGSSGGRVYFEFAD